MPTNSDPVKRNSIRSALKAFEAIPTQILTIGTCTAWLQVPGQRLRSRYLSDLQRRDMDKVATIRDDVWRSHAILSHATNPVSGLPS